MGDISTYYNLLISTGIGRTRGVRHRCKTQVGFSPNRWLVFFSQMSHKKSPALLSIESWLVNRDPYNGLL